MDVPTPASPTTSSSPSLVNLLAMLAALAMFLSTLEYLVPKPVPFFRIGLANIALLVTFHFFRFRHVVALAVVKVIGQGLIHGTLASYVFLFSLTGTLTSVIVMVLVHHAGGRRVSLIGVSTAGAVASNAVQIVLSVRFIFGAASWVIAPPFLLAGLAAGVLVGWIAQRAVATSRWVQQLEVEYRNLSGETA